MVADAAWATVHFAPVRRSHFLRGLPHRCTRGAWRTSTASTRCATPSPSGSSPTRRCPTRRCAARLAAGQNGLMPVLECSLAHHYEQSHCTIPSSSRTPILTCYPNPENPSPHAPRCPGSASTWRAGATCCRGTWPSTSRPRCCATSASPRSRPAGGAACTGRTSWSACWPATTSASSPRCARVYEQGFLKGVYGCIGRASWLACWPAITLASSPLSATYVPEP